MSQPVEIRTLTLPEVRQLVQWAALEGWNPSPADADAFFCADPDGFLGCFLAGHLVAGISAVSYGKTFGFIGLYIARQDFRGKGYGVQVWQAAMARLGGRTIGLDGVPAQQANYEKMGFRRAYGSARWSGRLFNLPPSSEVISATRQDFHDILPFDRRFFPADRDLFLKNWLSEPRDCYVARDANGLTGYVVVRKCLEGYKIGPLFAVDDQTAIALLAACGDTVGGEVVFLDVPETRESFARSLIDLGFQAGFQTARMYLGPPPSIGLSGVYAATTLELG
ncbi:MAG TPA: GNAT family N-acetyltransferase [Ensifer sp.]|nr:GNAT family N-acetyltransferase [Ensifer sp.]